MTAALHTLSQTRARFVLGRLGEHVEVKGEGAAEFWRGYCNACDELPPAILVNGLSLALARFIAAANAPQLALLNDLAMWLLEKSDDHGGPDWRRPLDPKSGKPIADQALPRFGDDQDGAKARAWALVEQIIRAQQQDYLWAVEEALATLAWFKALSRRYRPKQDRAAAAAPAPAAASADATTAADRPAS